MIKNSKQEVMNSIKAFADGFGFSFDNDQIVDPTRTVNFCITEKPDWSTRKEGYINITVNVMACIATMGSWSMGDKLKEQAEVIRRAGELVNTLKLNNDYMGYLTYTEEW